jgi:DNA-binding NarL/FixJ family response regulator
MALDRLSDAGVNTPAPGENRVLVDPAALGGLDQVLGADYELPQGKGSRRRASGPYPLSGRELDVLRRLAEGKVYKQIAAELDLSASTVRSHLHNVYGKLGALDRAQAVLMATEQGWI